MSPPAPSRFRRRDADVVMRQHLLLMRRFLDTQRSVMESLLVRRPWGPGVGTAVPGYAPRPMTVEVSPPQHPAPAHSTPSPAPGTLTSSGERVPQVGGRPEPRRSAGRRSKRFILDLEAAPPEAIRADAGVDGVVLIVAGDTEIADHLSRGLADLAQPTALACWGRETASGDSYGLVSGSEEAVLALVRAVRERQGPIGGVFYLLPLMSSLPLEELDIRSWHANLERDAKTLFHLLKATREDLDRAATSGGACVLAATGMGGDLGLGASGQAFPGGRTTHGLMKTVALEWPEVRIKSVDLNLDEPPEALADHLLTEFRSPDPLVEVGHDGRGRRRVALLTSALIPRGDDATLIDRSSVILVTGGARGITAEIACELAERYQPTLVIAGQSAPPPPEESEDTSPLTSAGELKSSLIARMKRRGEAFTLADVEAQYTRLCKDREMRSTFDALKGTGARLEYVQVDVRDHEAFGKLIDDLYGRYGKIDGVVHGAGVIDDKLIEAKSGESFDRVFRTKTDSAFVLSKKLRPESTRFLAFFSSIAGRFGNRGQGDYAAANEALNGLAAYLNRRWPGRVIAFNWGPWDKAGMVSDAVRRQFTERGVALVSPEDGRRLFDLELQGGEADAAEVVIGEGPWERKEARRHVPSEPLAHPPLLDERLASFRWRAGELQVVKRLDPQQDLYLQDHQLDGKPVLPAAVAIELMAETARVGWPAWRVAALRDVRVLGGVILAGGPTTLHLHARLAGEPCRADELVLEMEIAEETSPGRLCYRGRVVLSRSPAPRRSHRLPAATGMGQFPISVKESYGRWLFHGSRFQCIRSIEGVGKGGMIATLATSDPRDCVAHEPAAPWVIDPIVLDGGPQLAILWARCQHGQTALPSSFRAVQIHGPFSSSVTRCHLEVTQMSGEHRMQSNVFFVGADGLVSAAIEGMESIASAKLNRFAGSGAEAAAG